jgi:signal transduction histidine kinase
MLVAMLLDVSNLLLPLALPTSAHTVFIVLSEVTLPLALLIIPGTIGFAVLRYRLWDIDLLINRTLVYGLLTLSVLGLYILVVVGLGTVFSALGNLFLSLLATGLVAVLFQPLHQRLQRAINHLMFGERNEPYRVLSRLGQRLEEMLPAESFLPTIVETVAHALKLPYVAILWKPEPGLLGAESPRLAAALGTSNLSGAETRVPLVHQGEQVGELVLAPRQRGEELTPADLRLVRDLAPQIGIAVHAARLTSDLQRLTADLQRSRERLVAAREEERRRLRRDLHDGLGPQLSSQALMLSAIKKQLRQDPDTAEQLVNDAIAHAQEAITDIRRLVYARRPPALDDLGLLAALQEQINQYHASGIVLTLEAPERLPLLPAAIEIACYRIVQEALTNVVRHAHATAATIELRVQEDLVVEVRDNGQGLPPVVYSGVGLRSMRERAEELGGTCLIETRASRGTRVRARLPLLLGQHEEHETVQQGEEVP